MVEEDIFAVVSFIGDCKVLELSVSTDAMFDAEVLPEL